MISRWPQAFRIIRTIYPPIAIFEDIADPADWELLVAAAAKTNPRIRDVVGNLVLVPVIRRVSGPTASVVMGCFTHCSTDRPGRFSDGSYGVWYAGDRPEAALAETAHHFARFMAATAEPPGFSDMQELVAPVRGEWVEAPAACLAPDDWRPGQAFGRAARAAGSDGVAYASVRYPAGRAVALFWPDGVELPVRHARQFRYHWDGARMDRYLVHGTREWLTPATAPKPAPYNPPPESPGHN